MNIPRMLGLPRDLEEAARSPGRRPRADDRRRAGRRPHLLRGRLGRHACRRDAGAAQGGPGRLRGDRPVRRGRGPLSTLRRAHRARRRPHDRDEGAPRRGGQRALHGPGAPRRTRGASLDDGLFDVRVFLHDTKAELARDLTSIASGRRPDERHTLTERASWVRITSPRPLPVRADSTDLGTTPVVFEIRPRVLTVIAPVARHRAEARPGPDRPAHPRARAGARGRGPGR